MSSCTTLKRLKCTVGGVEECGGRGRGVWWGGGGWKSVMGGWRSVVGLEVCGGRGGGVWEGRGVWEGWRSVVGEWRNVVGGVGECGGKGKLCARAFKHKKYIPEKKVFAAIGVWEGVRRVGGVEVCGTVGWHV